LNFGGELNMLKIIEVNEISHFLELKTIWNNLLEKSRDNNPFLTWEYLFTYWKHFGKDKELKILCVKNERNEIIAIIPLRLSRYKPARLFTYNVIEPLAYRGADYNGVIITEKEAKCLKLVFDYLAGQKDWDFIYLYEILETSSAYKLLQLKNTIVPFDFYRGSVCPYITIHGLLENILKTLDSKFRKNLRRCLKRLQEDYGTVELIDFKKFKSIEDSMAAFFNLHQKRWLSKNRPGVFSTEETKNFFLDIAKKFAEKGWLALYFLVIDDRPVATQLCYEYSQKMYYVLGGFDPDFYQYSVGNIITLKMLEKCVEKSFKEYDFLKGGEPYKFDWTNTFRSILGFRFVNKKKAFATICDLGIKTIRRTKIENIANFYQNFKFI